MKTWIKLRKGLKNLKPPKLLIVRTDQDDVRTFGILYVDGKECCRILERPWLNNQVNISCIPTGRFKCKRVYSDTFKVETFEIEVNGRTVIRFHWGNHVHNSKGCPLTGQRVDEALWYSEKTFHHFMDLMEGIDKCEIEIKNNEFIV